MPMVTTYLSESCVSSGRENATPVMFCYTIIKCKTPGDAQYPYKSHCQKEVIKERMII